MSSLLRFISIVQACLQCRNTAMHARHNKLHSVSLSLLNYSVMWQRQAELEKELQAAKQAAEAQAASHALALAEQEARSCEQTEQHAAQSKAGLASLAAQVGPACLHAYKECACCDIMLTHCVQVKQLQEERDKLTAAAAASDEQRARIELLEKCLQQERSASAAAAADADRNLDAAKAVVHAARATVAAKERKASNLEALVEGCALSMIGASLVHSNKAIWWLPHLCA